MFRLNQVCEIHTKFKSQVIKGMSIACLLFGTLPLGMLPDPWENDHNFCPKKENSQMAGVCPDRGEGY